MGFHSPIFPEPYVVMASNTHGGGGGSKDCNTYPEYK
jgi:hypothetical protein